MLLNFLMHTLSLNNLLRTFHAILGISCFPGKLKMHFFMSFLVCILFKKTFSCSYNVCFLTVLYNILSIIKQISFFPFLKSLFFGIPHANAKINKCIKILIPDLSSPLYKPLFSRSSSYQSHLCICKQRTTLESSWVKKTRHKRRILLCNADCRSALIKRCSWRSFFKLAKYKKLIWV